jgi:uracil-DNA glycosylase
MSAQACRERLLRELLIVQPKVIVPIGNLALWALTDVPKMSIFDYRGGRLVAHLEEVLAAVIAGTARAPIRQVQEK